jgi:hypothetical protein
MHDQKNTLIQKELKAVSKLENELRERIGLLFSLVQNSDVTNDDNDSENGASNSSLPVVITSKDKTWGPGVKIPDDVREQVKALLKDNVKPAEIRNKLQVSLPMIHKIKSSMGLVKHRGGIFVGKS